MNINILNNIKTVESHDLQILVFNEGLTVPLDDLIALNGLGDVIIAVETPIEAGWLIGKVSGMKMKVVLSRRIPAKNYDVLIASYFNDLIRLLTRNLKIKYLCFTQFVYGFDLINYYEFEENSYKLTANNGAHPIRPPKPPLAPPPLSGTVEHDECGDETDGAIEPDVENDASNYEVIIKEIASTEMKYDKYTLNYLHPAVPGKISIIMIVSSLNNNFAEVIREIRAQNLPSLEIIIIDNAAGFRNNVKPDIRYGSQMPLDYCEYNAKELTTGEYIITLNQDSEAFDVMTAINQGHYETR